MTHHAHWRDVSPGHFASKHTDTERMGWVGKSTIQCWGMMWVW